MWHGNTSARFARVVDFFLLICVGGRGEKDGGEEAKQIK